jgi:hypothetical protein
MTRAAVTIAKLITDLEQAKAEVARYRQAMTDENLGAMAARLNQALRERDEAHSEIERAEADCAAAIAQWSAVSQKLNSVVLEIENLQVAWVKAQSILSLEPVSLRPSTLVCAAEEVRLVMDEQAAEEAEARTSLAEACGLLWELHGAWHRGDIDYEPILERASAFASIHAQELPTSDEPVKIAPKTTTVAGLDASRQARQAHMLICAVRYALGRSSYVVGEAADWVRELWPDLGVERRVIERDVQQYVTRTGVYRGYGLGDDIDQRTWTDLLAWMMAAGGQP